LAQAILARVGSGRTLWRHWSVVCGRYRCAAAHCSARHMIVPRLGPLCLVLVSLGGGVPEDERCAVGLRGESGAACCPVDCAACGGGLPTCGGNPDCWSAEYTFERCCTGEGSRASFCWDGAHTFDRCCFAPGSGGSPADRAGRALRSPAAAWQGAKLGRHREKIEVIDQRVEQELFARFRPLAQELRGAAVLCVGARLGGEVRAFTRHGALAVGVDFNPGEHNLFVMAGDAENLQFADSVFENVFTNVVDHISDVRAFAAESRRVLRGGGRLWVDASLKAPGMFEVRDLRGRLAALEHNITPWFHLVERLQADFEGDAKRRIQFQSKPLS